MPTRPTPPEEPAAGSGPIQNRPPPRFAAMPAPPARSCCDHTGRKERYDVVRYSSRLPKPQPPALKVALVICAFDVSPDPCRHEPAATNVAVPAYGLSAFTTEVWCLSYSPEVLSSFEDFDDEPACETDAAIFWKKPRGFFSAGAGCLPPVDPPKKRVAPSAR